MGYSLCKMADFQNCLISFLEYLAFVFERFFLHNNSAILVKIFFASFSHFKFLTEAKHFASAIAFASAIVFGRWSIFNVASFLEYLVFFRAVFLHRATLFFFVQWFFCMFFAF